MLTWFDKDEVVVAAHVGDHKEKRANFGAGNVGNDVRGPMGRCRFRSSSTRI